jgi:hypothetical protein
MKTRLDGQCIFDDEELSVQAGSEQRQCVERSVAGLDGLLSIDLGLRGRQIKQTGVLRAGSEAALRKKLSTISAYMDGQTHTLTLDNGEEYDYLRMDSFKVTGTRPGGSDVCCEYEIRYTLLRG